jgi:hypothetical protein
MRIKTVASLQERSVQQGGKHPIGYQPIIEALRNPPGTDVIMSQLRFTLSNVTFPDLIGKGFIREDQVKKILGSPKMMVL